MTEPSITLAELTQIRGSLPRRGHYIKGVDYVMRWVKAEQLRQEVEEASEFEALLLEELRLGNP